jgi:hypothetical protein
MGAWATDSFSNDDAADWFGDLETQGDFSTVEAALDAVIDCGEDYLEAPDGAVGLAAAEVVAAAFGKAGDAAKKHEGLVSWLAGLNAPPSPDLVGKAIATVDRIVTEPSELMELWEDSDDYEAWQADVTDLRARLAD